MCVCVCVCVCVHAHTHSSASGKLIWCVWGWGEGSIICGRRPPTSCNGTLGEGGGFLS